MSAGTPVPATARACWVAQWRDSRAGGALWPPDSLGLCCARGLWLEPTRKGLPSCKAGRKQLGVGHVSHTCQGPHLSSRSWTGHPPPCNPAITRGQLSCRATAESSLPSPSGHGRWEWLGMMSCLWGLAPACSTWTKISAARVQEREGWNTTGAQCLHPVPSNHRLITPGWRQLGLQAGSRAFLVPSRLPGEGRVCDSIPAPPQDGTPDRRAVAWCS